MRPVSGKRGGMESFLDTGLTDTASDETRVRMRNGLNEEERSEGSRGGRWHGADWRGDEADFGTAGRHHATAGHHEGGDCERETAGAAATAALRAVRRRDSQLR